MNTFEQVPQTFIKMLIDDLSFLIDKIDQYNDKRPDIYPHSLLTIVKTGAEGLCSGLKGALNDGQHS